MKFKFDYKNKKIEMNVEICNNILSQARGLMFRKKGLPLLFIFNKSKKRTIHSFFCMPFIAIWFDNNKIIDIKLIDKWKFSIKPFRKFNKLLEIPCYNKNFLIFPTRETFKY